MATRKNATSEDSGAKSTEEEREDAGPVPAPSATTTAPAATGATTGEPGAGGAGAPPAPTLEDKPVKARVPYPHARLTVPGGGADPGEGGERRDLVITRQWTAIPADQVERVKQSAYRARIKLQMAIPDTEQTGE